MADLEWRVPNTALQLQNAWTNCVPRIGTGGTWERWDISAGDWTDSGVVAAVHNAYIGANNHWYTWDDDLGAYVDSNVVAGYTAYTGDVEEVT